MFARGERFTDSRATSMTVLRSELRRHLHDLPASVCRFARQDLEEGIPRCVTDAFGQMMILHQAFDVQVFDRDRIKFTDELEHGLVVKVCALPRHLLMLPPEQHNSLAATVAALVCAARHLALCGLQPAFGVLQVSRILNHLAGRKRGEVLKADINAHAVASLRQETALVFFNGEDDVPAVRFAFDGAGPDRACDGTTEAHAATADFREMQLVAFKSEAALRVAERVEAVTALEARITRRLAIFHTAEEVLKGALQLPQRLL